MLFAERQFIVMKQSCIKITSLLICSFLITILAGCVSHKKQVDTVMDAIPDATRFVEENKVFLDLLLEFQSRINQFNNDSLETSLTDCPRIIDYYRIYIHQAELIIFVYYTESFNSKQTEVSGSVFDLLSDDEKILIENKLLDLQDMMTDKHQLGIYMSSERISIDFTRYRRASLVIESPAEEFERHFGNAYRSYEYATKVNNDWCLHLYKFEYD